MTKIYDGGPAFPTPENKFGEYTPGLSLRDWFAGQALAGMGTWMPHPSDCCDAPDLRSAGALQRRSAWAYAQADAMLAVRKEPKA